MVNDCFNEPSKIVDINQTLLTLIPKKTEFSQVNHLRPMALCNVSYKIITKIISHRLRPIFPYVIDNSQSSFIPGRSSIDNILVLQEINHSISHLNGRKGYIIIKLDLEKDYDRLEWPFIMETLRLLNLSNRLCSVIFNCISSTSISVNWNCKNSSSFSSSWDLRQGDPISPYLFVLAIERLSHKIKDLVNSGDWNGFKFGRGDGPRISHICFADDLILVADTNINQALMIKETLDEFCSCSG